MKLFAEQSDFNKPAWLEPVFLAIAALISLAFGFVLGSVEASTAVAAVPVVLLIVYLGYVNPELLAVVLVGLTWGYISSVAVKFHNMPSVAKPLILFLAGILIIRRFTGKRVSFVYHPAQWWVLAYLVVVGAGMWYASWPDRTLVMTIEVAKQLVFFFVVTNLVSSERTLERVIWGLVIVGGLLGFFTFYQEITQTYTNTYGGFARSEVAQISENVANRARAGGPTSDPNVFGQQLLTVIPLALWLALSARSWVGRLVGGASAAMCLAGVGLTFSRGAYLAVGVMFILLVFHLRLNPRYLLVIPLLWLALSMAPPEIRARFDTLSTLLPDSSTSVADGELSIRRRSIEMFMAFYMFMDYPLLGVGGDNYVPNYPRYIREYGGNVPDEQRNAHTFYLEVAAETGVVGVIIMGGILVIAMRGVLQARRLFAAVGHNRTAELAISLAIAFSGFLVSATFLQNDFPDFIWTLITLCIACNLVARRAYQQAGSPVVAPDTGAGGFVEAPVPGS